jgi:hypothetical protein
MTRPYWNETPLPSRERIERLIAERQARCAQAEAEEAKAVDPLDPYGWAAAFRRVRDARPTLGELDRRS